MYKVSISRPAQKNARNIPTDYYQTIVKRIFELAENPRPLGCRKLVGFENLYRIRIGVYRIIYSIKDDILIVEVIKIDHRSSVYRA